MSLVCRCMLLLTVSTAAPSVRANVLVIDDFTQGPWTTTLSLQHSFSHEWLNLDKRHCLFGYRRALVQIVSNPNQTTLTYSMGNHEQKLSSPVPIAWMNTLTFENISQPIDLQAVDRFMLDFYSEGGSPIPDVMTLKVRDSWFRSDAVSFFGRIGGVYFDKKKFNPNIDWAHINLLELRQNFESLPNPTLYSATNFYATLKPGVAPPASRIDPLDTDKLSISP